MAPSSLPDWEVFVDEACTQKPVVGQVYLDYYIRNNTEIEFTPTQSDKEAVQLWTPNGDEETYFRCEVIGVKNGQPAGKIGIYMTGSIQVTDEEFSFMTFNSPTDSYDHTEGNFIIPPCVFHISKQTQTAEVAWNSVYSDSGDWIPGD